MRSTSPEKIAFAVKAPEKRLFTVREAGYVIGLGDWAIRRLIWQRRLPCVRIGRRVLLAREDLDAFIEECRGPIQ